MSIFGGFKSLWQMLLCWIKTRVLACSKEPWIIEKEELLFINEKFVFWAYDNFLEENEDLFDKGPSQCIKTFPKSFINYFFLVYKIIVLHVHNIIIIDSWYDIKLPILESFVLNNFFDSNFLSRFHIMCLFKKLCTS